jgi:hypothetical protein
VKGERDVCEREPGKREKSDLCTSSTSIDADIVLLAQNSAAAAAGAAAGVALTRCDRVLSCDSRRMSRVVMVEGTSQYVRILTE